MIYGKDKIEVLNKEQGYEASNGDWVEGNEVIAVTYLCDAEPAQGNANVITAPDGRTILYAYVISLDVSCVEIPVGTDVVLYCGGKQPQRLTAKGFHRYATLCKLWV